jgi:hypothetical protein
MIENEITPGEFRMLLIETLPTELIEFLETQYTIDRQRNPGKDLDFLYYVLDNIELDKEKHGGMEILIDSRIDLVKKWVNAKIEQLNSTGNPIPAGGKTKNIKLNDLNKPVLNQSQISILFSIMKELNIISNRDLSKTMYSEIIQTLTGYSDNTLRTNFSAKQLIEISDRPQDYQEIIDNLYLIIDKLLRAKGEISTSK